MQSRSIMPMNRAMRILETVTSRLGRVTSWVVIVAVGVMTVMVAAEVFSRYVLASSIIFANELARLMFVWTIFLGLPLALMRGRHVGMTLLLVLLPATASRQVKRIGTLCAGVLMATVLYQSAGLVIDTWDQRLNTLPFSAALFLLPIPIGTGLCLLHLLRLAVEPDLQAEPAEDREIQ